MIAVELTIEERLQFQYILPVQGSLRTLELVESILDKTKIDDTDKDIKPIDFHEDEVIFIKRMIRVLDEQQQLNIQSLSLIRKFLSIKGD